MIAQRIKALHAELIALVCALAAVSSGGCRHDAPATPPRPDVSSTSQPAAALPLDRAKVKPMYRELVFVDLDIVANVAAAQNLEIEQARNRIAAQQGRYDTSIQALFPVIAPSIGFQRVSGVNQEASGSLVDVD
jgi:hypothetical protein